MWQKHCVISDNMHSLSRLLVTVLFKWLSWPIYLFNYLFARTWYNINNYENSYTSRTTKLLSTALTAALFSYSCIYSIRKTPYIIIIVHYTHDTHTKSNRKSFKMPDKNRTCTFSDLWHKEPTCDWWTPVIIRFRESYNSMNMSHESTIWRNLAATA